MCVCVCVCEGVRDGEKEEERERERERDLKALDCLTILTLPNTKAKGVWREGLEGWGRGGGDGIIDRKTAYDNEQHLGEQ